jgi:PGM1 C-terminal domain/ATP-grasp domain
MQETRFSDALQRLCFQPKELRTFPAGSTLEHEYYTQLQQQFSAQYDTVFPDKLAPKTIVVIPSLTLDPEILSKIDGFIHYEERLLCMLILLRMPCTHLVYITSVPIDPVVIDYYLHLLPGISAYHASQRLTLLSCYDNSALPLTQKILERPRLIARIKKSIPAGHAGHIACFNVTQWEKTLAVSLDLPIYGADPDLLYLGTKSGSRKLFRECHTTLPDGVEDIKDEAGIAAALLSLKQRYPDLKKAVVKMNDGFSGEGNAIFYYEGYPFDETAADWVKQMLPAQLRIVAAGLEYQEFMQKFTGMGGVVELFLEGEIKTSPSVQCRITPTGKVEIISTHDQILGGDGNQVFLGARFPAQEAYNTSIAQIAAQVSEKLSQLGVLGRFSIDFVSVCKENKWQHYAIEVNLRKGGTTHPYLMLQFLTDGHYDENTGLYYTANGQPRYYFSSDNLQNPAFKGLTPHDLMEIASFHDLLYDGSKQEGVMFHLMGALSQYGKLGVLCIGNTPQRADDYYKKTVEVLQAETQKGK